MGIRTGLSYGGVLLVPQRSPINNRSDVGLSTNMTPNLCLDTSLVSTVMDAATEVELVGALSGPGGLGVVHRLLDVGEQAEQIRHATGVGGTIAGAVGTSENYLDRAEAFLDAGADAIVMDIIHSHTEPCLDAVERTRGEFDPEIVAGNAATSTAVEDLWEVGTGCVKVGVGPGLHCMTREAMGVGCPQLTAVSECAERMHDLGIYVMVDGGVQTSDDTAKALMAGADTVMMGSFFAGTDETSDQIIEADGKMCKRSRGMAFTEATGDREDKQSDVDAGEGVEAFMPYEGPVELLVKEFLGGIRSGVSYCDGHALMDARERASFVRVAASAKECEGAHGVVFAGGPVEADEEAERKLQAPMTG